METTIYERIAKIVYDSGKVQQDFARSIGVSSRTLFTYLQKKSKISTEAIEAICRNYDVNANWLLLGEGNIYRSDEPSPASSVVSDEDYEKNNVAKLLLQIEAMQKNINTLLETNKKLVEAIK